MKTIGILGGMSWESTAVYYRRLNELVREARGGVASADVVMHSYDFERIEKLQQTESWDEMATILITSALNLRNAGADFLVIATNTMHLLAERIQSEAGISILHIADAVAESITEAGLSSVALLGTRFTMERSFYRDRLRDQCGATVLIPDEAERNLIHQIIYTELCSGITRDESRDHVVAIINRLATTGAQAAVLGCTELPLLVRNAEVPVLDTTELHIQAIARAALE